MKEAFSGHMREGGRASVIAAGGKAGRGGGYNPNAEEWRGTKNVRGGSVGGEQNQRAIRGRGEVCVLSMAQHLCWRGEGEERKEGACVRGRPGTWPTHTHTHTRCGRWTIASSMSASNSTYMIGLNLYYTPNPHTVSLHDTMSLSSTRAHQGILHPTCKQHISQFL